jgi:hypothetical protein
MLHAEGRIVAPRVQERVKLLVVVRSPVEDQGEYVN